MIQKTLREDAHVAPMEVWLQKQPRDSARMCQGTFFVLICGKASAASRSARTENVPGRILYSFSRWTYPVRSDTIADR